MHQTIVAQLERGQLPAGVVVENEAALLTALVPALGQNMLDGSMHSNQAFELFDYALTKAFA